MAYQQRDFSGSLFKNKKREKDTHPQATGEAMIDGVMYWVNAWTKQDKNGNPWQSLSFKRQEQAPRGERVFPKKQKVKPSQGYDNTERKPQPGNGFDDMEDDLIPF